MAQKRSRRPTSSSPATPPSISPQDAIRLLTRQKEKAVALLEGQRLQETDSEAWRNTTREVLIQAFGSESRNVSAVINAGSIMIIDEFTGEADIERMQREHLQASIKMLDSCIEQLEMLAPVTGSESEGEKETVYSRKVFVVHGHDEGKKDAVARLLDNLEVEPIILHEKANYGMTLIEKFEHYADVGFAVVILTGDDKASPLDHPEDQRLRARQNVIFELGYFIGRLGRRRVCALHEQGIELPSDYQGVVYIPYDPAGAWKMLIARELKAAGIDVDVNLAI